MDSQSLHGWRAITISFMEKGRSSGSLWDQFSHSPSPMSPQRGPALHSGSKGHISSLSKFCAVFAVGNCCQENDRAGFAAQVRINVPLLGLFARGCSSERHFTLQISNLSCKPIGSSEQSRRLGGQQRGTAG